MADFRKSLLYKEWLRNHERIQRQASIKYETEAEKQARISRAKKDYAFFVKTYFGEVARVPCAKFQVDAAKQILNNRNAASAFIWARGHAKSTHLGVFIPLWLKIQDTRQFHTMLLVGKSEDAADRLLADLQQELAYNDDFIRDFGHQIKEGNWAEGEFATTDGYYFAALGRGQSPRGIKRNGRRPDYIVIDDIDDDEMVRNPKRVRELSDWVFSALFGTMEAGRGRFIIVGNLIAKNSVLSNFIEKPSVFKSTVNILDKHGNPSWKENYAIEEVQRIRVLIGERNFQKEYMNNPLTEGAVFQKKHIIYGKMLPLAQYKQLICYTDPSFKNSSTADYKATMLVGKTPSGHFHLLKAFAAQTSVSEMVEWHYQILEYVNGRCPILFYMEANFMQDLMLDEFYKAGISRGEHVPIIGDKSPKGDKFARIEAMQPLFERGLVIFNEAEKNAPGMNVLEEQLLLFEKGSRAHDDAPDALESAIRKLAARARTCAAPYYVNPRKSRKF